MFKYIASCKTDASVPSSKSGTSGCHLTITDVHYFVETSTKVMYMQCVYDHSLNLRDPATPLVKPDGSYLTFPEWSATQDEER